MPDEAAKHASSHPTITELGRREPGRGGGEDREGCLLPWGQTPVTTRLSALSRPITGV